MKRAFLGTIMAGFMLTAFSGANVSAAENTLRVSKIGHYGWRFVSLKEGTVAQPQYSFLMGGTFRNWETQSLEPAIAEQMKDNFNNAIKVSLSHSIKDDIVEINQLLPVRDFARTYGLTLYITIPVELYSSDPAENTGAKVNSRKRLILERLNSLIRLMQTWGPVVGAFQIGEINSPDALEETAYKQVLTNSEKTNYYAFLQRAAWTARGSTGAPIFIGLKDSSDASYVSGKSRDKMYDGVAVGFFMDKYQDERPNVIQNSKVGTLLDALLKNVEVLDKPVILSFGLPYVDTRRDSVRPDPSGDNDPVDQANFIYNFTRAVAAHMAYDYNGADKKFPRVVAGLFAFEYTPLSIEDIGQKKTVYSFFTETLQPFLSFTELSEGYRAFSQQLDRAVGNRPPSNFDILLNSAGSPGYYDFNVGDSVSFVANSLVAGVGLDPDRNDPTNFTWYIREADKPGAENTPPGPWQAISYDQTTPSFTMLVLNQWAGKSIEVMATLSDGIHDPVYSSNTIILHITGVTPNYPPVVRVANNPGVGTVGNTRFDTSTLWIRVFDDKPLPASDSEVIANLAGITSELSALGLKLTRDTALDTPYARNWYVSPAGGTTFTTAGIVSFYVAARDSNGAITNSGPIYITINPASDTTPPFINVVNTPLNVLVGDSFSSQPVLRVSVYDNGPLPADDAVITLIRNTQNGNANLLSELGLGIRRYYSSSDTASRKTWEVYPLSGTYDTAGSLTIEVEARDSAGNARVSGPIRITVNANTPPVIDEATPEVVYFKDSDTGVTFKVKAHDPEGRKLTYRWQQRLDESMKDIVSDTSYSYEFKDEEGENGDTFELHFMLLYSNYYFMQMLGLKEYPVQTRVIVSDGKNEVIVPLSGDYFHVVNEKSLSSGN